MSKVFSAKRKTIEVTYEFLNGDTKEIIANSLSSKEQEEITNNTIENGTDVIENYKSIVKKQLSKNAKKLVSDIIKEQYEEGDIIEFSNALSETIREEKEKK